MAKFCFVILRNKKVCKKYIEIQLIIKALMPTALIFFVQVNCLKGKQPNWLSTNQIFIYLKAQKENVVDFRQLYLKNE